jgi:hypothetical protein
MLVGVEVEDRIIILFNDMLGAIPVACVKIDDEDFLITDRLRIARSDGNVVKIQKPMARSASAWCPGGRIRQNARSIAPVLHRSTASMTAPAAYSAASRLSSDISVSGSSSPAPNFIILFIYSCVCTRATSSNVALRGFKCVRFDQVPDALSVMMMSASLSPESGCQEGGTCCKNISS